MRARRRIAITAVVLLIAGAYIWFTNAEFAPSDPYPELAAVDAEVRDAIFRLLPERMYGGEAAKTQRAVEFAGPKGALEVLESIHELESTTRILVTRDGRTEFQTAEERYGGRVRALREDAREKINSRR